MAASLDIGKLCAAIHSARQELRFARADRVHNIRLYQGGHWSEQSREKCHLNLLSLYISIVSRNLISKSPRVMLSTFNMAQKPVVNAMQSWINEELEKIDFAETMKRVVLDALFSIGICKTALATPEDAGSAAWNVAAGTPFAERVDLDDFVFDIHARDFSEVDFIGHRYRAPLSVVRESKRFTRQRKELAASTDPRFNQEGDERVNVLGRGYQGGDEEAEDKVDLWEIYCPRHRCVYTFSEDNLTGAGAATKAGYIEALGEQEWIGPAQGPYTILGYGTMPGNAMPKAPIQDLVDLHVPINKILRKLIRQAERQKDIVLVRRSNDGDAERYRSAEDGELVPSDDPKAVVPVSFGGPNQILFQFFVQLKEVFSWIAGNLDIMGGLSPQSKTATQDTMLNQNSTRSIADMQDRTLVATSAVLKKMCWYWWHDPMRVMRTTYAQPGLAEISIPRHVFPRGQGMPGQLSRAADWSELDIRVDPYSMQHSTPQQRANDLQQLVAQTYVPMAQMAAQQGVAFDFHAFLDLMAQYRDMPDLKRILTVQEPIGEEPELAVNSATAGPGPANTTRTYIRESMPGRTRQGNDMNLMNSLAGVDVGGANGKPNGIH